MKEQMSMKKIITVTVFFMTLVWSAQAQSVVMSFMSVPFGVDQRHAVTILAPQGWLPSTHSVDQAWAIDAAGAFRQMHESNPQAIEMVVFQKFINGSDVQMLFFFHKNRLFAKSSFLYEISVEQFVEMVRQIGGETSAGALGYGRPVEMEAPNRTYFWFLNASQRQSLIFTYLGVTRRPSVSLLAMDEDLSVK
jgi:hypothetical protein